MDFKKSFKKLADPMVWVHYALGSLIILGIFVFLMNSGIVLPKSPFTTYFISFLIVYVISDRFVHGLLELD